MAITTYAELQAAAANWLVRADMTSRIPEFISLAEARINRVLRNKRMEAIDVATVTTEYGTVPTDFLDAISFEMSDGSTAWRLQPAPQEVVDDAVIRTGRPRFYVRVADQFRFYPTPDQSYSATLTYFAKLPALSISNTSNWLLSLAPDLYLYGTLTAAAPLLRDADALSVYSSGFDLALKEVNRTERNRVGPLRTEAAQLQGWRNRAYDITQDQ